MQNTNEQIVIENLDDVITTLNGDINATIITADGRLPSILCGYIKHDYLKITEDLFYNENYSPEPKTLVIRTGQNINRNDLINAFIEYGYKKTMENPNTYGEFCSRGDVIDIWLDNDSHIITRIILLDDIIETIKTVAPRSFSKLNILDSLIINSITPPMPDVCLNNINALLNKNRGKFKTLIFEYPDEFTDNIQAELLTKQHIFDDFVCIGFQMMDKPHNIFDVAKAIVIRTDFVMPEVGDFVIHQNHGLGRFIGFKKMALIPDSPEKNYIVLQYARNTLVYVPPEKTSLLANYHGNYKRISHL